MKSLLDIFVEHTLLNRNDEFNKYVTHRNWNQKTIDEWRLGFFPESSVLSLIAKANDAKFGLIDLEKNFVCKKIGYNYRSLLFNRIIFPIYDAFDNVLAVSGRVLDESKPKYFNTVFQKAKHLFGLNLTKKYIYEAKRVLVFEGYADVISSYQNEIKNVTCCMGTALTEEHYVLLSRYASEIVAFFDNDSAGFQALQRFNDKCIGERRTDTRILRCFLNKYKDVDEFLKNKSAEEFNAYVNSYVSNEELQGRLEKLNSKMSATEIVMTLKFAENAGGKIIGGN